MGAEHGTFWDSDVNDARRYWEARFTAARRFMQERRDQDSVLIEVAAQHPLIGGSQPNEEFIARLDRGKELFDRFRPDVERIEIYVPGSRHVFEGAADEISLSDAGKNYLREIGVPTELIRGEDLNQAYKGEVGVCNSADECFVAASYFKDHDCGRVVRQDSLCGANGSSSTVA